MKGLGYFFFLSLIGFSLAQDYCPSQATVCEGCSAKWDYNNITSEFYVQTNGKCTAVFTWPFEYDPDDSNPWLKFMCEYSKTGEICNSRNDTICASCLTYTITDLDVLYDPYVIFYDSCQNFFDISLTKPCVNAGDGTTKNPKTNPAFTTTLGTQTSGPSDITEATMDTSSLPLTTHAPIITSQNPPTTNPVYTITLETQTSSPSDITEATMDNSSLPVTTHASTITSQNPPTTKVTDTTTEKIQTTQFPVSTTQKERTTYPSNKTSTPISTTYKPETSHFSTGGVTTVTTLPPVTTHEPTQPPVSTTQEQRTTIHTFTKTSTLVITTHETKTPNFPTDDVTVTSDSSFTGTPSSNCPDFHECDSCPENYTIPSFTQHEKVVGNGECTVTFTWEYPYEEDIRMEFLCYYLEGENCHKEEPYVCGSCEEFTIHNIKNFEKAILEYLDSCGNRKPIRLTSECH
ncbi:UNVERIFIED_CONTAM: hypothetical protein RMT77_010405 [Armadillidium vulgare]